MSIWFLNRFKQTCRSLDLNRHQCLYNVYFFFIIQYIIYVGSYWGSVNTEVLPYSLSESQYVYV